MDRVRQSLNHHIDKQAKEAFINVGNLTDIKVADTGFDVKEIPNMFNYKTYKEQPNWAY